jgi:hypothetical protein
MGHVILPVDHEVNRVVRKKSMGVLSTHAEIVGFSLGAMS